MIGIYKIVSPSNRIYIGQSSNIEKRFKVYLKSPSKVKSQTKLYNSIMKYGSESHTFEIVELCEIELLNEKERYYQDFYNVLDPKIGLNCRLTKTDDKTGILSEETKDKIRKHNLGKKLSQETKDKISEGNKGKIFTEEERKRVSENHSRHNALLADEDVIVICEVYKNGGTTKDVKEKYPLLKDCVLSQIRRGITYKHITSNYNLSKPSKKGIIIKRKQVLCIEDNIVFNGIKDAADYYNVSFKTISAIINNKIKKPKINKSFRYV